jgi:hypothetical protein
LLPSGSEWWLHAQLHELWRYSRPSPNLDGAVTFVAKSGWEIGVLDEPRIRPLDLTETKPRDILAVEVERLDRDLEHAVVEWHPSRAVTQVQALLQAARGVVQRAVVTVGVVPSPQTRL